MKPLDGPARHRPRISPTCTPGGSSTSGRRLDRPRSRLPGSSPAKATFRSPCTPEPSSAAPMTGVRRPLQVDSPSKCRSTRILEVPRVTLPYTEEQWAAIVAARPQGRRRPERAATCALPWAASRPSSPSTTSDGAEWNTAALGPTKRVLADELSTACATQFAPGGLLHYGQGKWYPGEHLPRWAFAALLARRWRAALAGSSADRQRRAERRRRDADGRRATSPRARARAGAASRLRHCRLRGRRISSDRAEAAAQRRPADNKLEDPQERERLVRVFERGLDKPAGYVLPLQVGTARRGGEAGSPSAGASGASTCSCCRAIRRWDSGCRLSRSPSYGPSTPRMSFRSILSPPMPLAAARAR